MEVQKFIEMYRFWVWLISLCALFYIQIYMCVCIEGYKVIMLRIKRFMSYICMKTSKNNFKILLKYIK